MKAHPAVLVSLMLSGLVASAAAQTASANRANSATGAVIASPFQALGNITRNPDAPPPPPPRQVTEPLRLPTVIPPNTIGTTSGR